jgi:hypothetical protein
MKKTLQDQYLLIKEGKGHKGVFLSEAKRQFPDIVRNAATFNEAAASLITKKIISENVIGLGAINSPFEVKKKQSFETAFESFLAEAKKKENEEEKVKAEEKKVSKPVEEDYSRNFDRKDDKNIDNLIFDQVMTGYYAEMKDPKNADKTMQELKDIVMKNLQKDPIFYTKDGQFGVKGLGYTTEAPGLGTPKEAKGKYKSSGYGDLKESVEKKFVSNIKDLATKKTTNFTQAQKIAKIAQKREEDLEDRKLRDKPLNEKAYLGAYGNYPHQSTPLDIEDYLEQVEGMSKSEAIEYLGKQGLSSSQALKVISQMDTDVRDMFDDTDVKIYSADDLYEQKIREVIREMIAGELEEVAQLSTIMAPFKSEPKDTNPSDPKDQYPSISPKLEDFLRSKKYLKSSGNTILIRSKLLNKSNFHLLPIDTEYDSNFLNFLNNSSNIGGSPIKLPVDGVLQDFTPLNNVKINRNGKLSFFKPAPKNSMKDIMESLKESVEKDLSDINKEAEQEVLQTKLEKIDALIDHRRSKLSKLDEDEDMKALTDKKKVKELEKDIKALENAKKKVEKIMSKFKGKKAESKEVIDEMDNADAVVANVPEGIVNDALRRLENEEEIDSILSNYQNISVEDKNNLRIFLNSKKASNPRLDQELNDEDPE